MQIGILGSGVVGQTVGKKLVELGYDVLLGGRDRAKLETWQESVAGKAQIGSYAEAATYGELIINALPGMVAVETLKEAGVEHLGNNIMIDISNPLDFSQGLPPSLSVSNTDSLGEQIQRTFPDLRVVKTLNTINTELMVNPAQIADGDHHIFVCGNDAAAKAKVSDILREMGWRNILDLGDISTARGTEMFLPLWVRLWGALGTPMFNVKIVR